MRRLSTLLPFILGLLFSGATFAQCVAGDQIYYRNMLVKHKWSTRGVHTSTQCTGGECKTTKELTPDVTFSRFYPNGQVGLSKASFPNTNVITAKVQMSWRLNGSALLFSSNGDSMTSQIQCAGDDRIVFVDEDGDEIVLERAA